MSVNNFWGKRAVPNHCFRVLVVVPPETPDPYQLVVAISCLFRYKLSHVPRYPLAFSISPIGS